MLGVHEWRVILLLVLVVTSAGEDGDPCDPANHDVMDDPWRSSSHKEPAGSKRCDATLSEKWYRPLGVNMVTSPPDLNRCGTSFPIYLNKTIPNSTDITEVTVCMRTMFSKCHDSWKIRVKNCKGYYVYELKQTRLCDAAYCFGDKLKCPAGQNSETGYQPDCGVPPDVKLIAQITVELNETTTEVKETPTILKGIVFQCDISSDEDLTDYVYDIQWSINDNSIVTHRNIPYTNLTQTGLHQSEWTGTYRMSFLVKCAVRARNNTSVPTPYQSSDEFYAGYITDSSEYEVFENSATTMTISLTVPIDCLYPVSYTPEEIKIHLKNECYITIRVLAPTYYDINGDIKYTYGGVTDEPVSFDNGDCGVKFKFNEWSTPKNFTIYGSADNVVNTYVRMTRIRFQVDDSVVSLAWPFSTKPDHKVYVKDKDKDLQDKTCCLQTDPHLNTFDGVADLLELPGEFIVYAHTALPIQIIGKFEKCWQEDRGTCTCAIAIRYMDDVFVLNFCKKKTHFADLRACGDPLITIKYGKSTYEVMLPTGLEIYIGLHQGKLNTHINMVILKTSLADWGATIGLCGVLDGDKETDLQPRSEKASMGFEESWKVDTNLDGPSPLN